MKLWLLALILACAPTAVIAEDGPHNVPSCQGTEAGYVTFFIAPNGSTLYYLADRPMGNITSTKNLTCSFEMNRRVRLEGEL